MSASIWTPWENAHFFDRTFSLKNTELVPPRVNILHQVHGNRVFEVKDSNYMEVPTADASITTQDGIGLSIHTADCIPILFKSPTAVAAAHAGWRGVSQLIIAETVQKLMQTGCAASDIKAALGPSIGPCHFEVGQDVADLLLATVKENKNRFVKNHNDPMKKYIDLAAIARQHLIALGILEKNIYQHGDCTYCNPGKYFSYRRDDKQIGRLESVIWK